MPSGDGAPEEVDLVLLAHDHVLEQVLQGLRAALAAGWLDRLLQCFHDSEQAGGDDRVFDLEAIAVW
jgi:hypothetical protein